MVRTHYGIPDIAKKVANELGRGWKSDDGSHWDGSTARLRGPNGEALYLDMLSAESRRTGRVHISGSLEPELARRVNGAVVEPSIGVSVSKPAARIANDIRARLLPLCDQMVKAAEERVRLDDERDAALKALAQEIVTSLGPGGQLHRDGIVRFSEPRQPVYASINPDHYRGKARFEISIASDLAPQLAKALGSIAIQAAA
ncbi:hypothetical protein JNUCC0626_40295 [Lentzea sp. JNUCC 0626]|uniref:hypothetical protein n=1 Tax=Lentzea sp. JNUCC 0626 TaxID=3367513 RepID=UPI0037489FAC